MESGQLQNPDPATPAHEEVENVHEQQAQQQQGDIAEDPRVSNQPSNPVVTSQQTVTEPARSGTPNPVRTSEQQVTEPAQQEQTSQPTENDDRDDVDQNPEPHDVDEPTLAHPDTTPEESN